jgi:hypothetical protein
MDIRVKKLLDVFQQNGWEFVGSVDISSDWWFSEVLQLCSIWKPIGTQLYLTLLTDPQIHDKKIVWCIGISSMIPGSRHESFIDQLTLNDINRIDLSAFVGNINRYVLVDQ